MTRAELAFFNDGKYVKSAYYNSDGYPGYVGKMISNYLVKHMEFENIQFLFGDYLTDKSTEVNEIISNGQASSDIDYFYALYFETESKKVGKIVVKSYGENEEFSGDTKQFCEWIKSLTE